jgi:myo-inositol-1(or 4)-monophosphatase
VGTIASRKVRPMWEGDVWVAVRAARAGADIVQAGFFEPLDTEMKSAVDPVTQVDRDTEVAIRAVITAHFPEDGILGEEGGGEDWREGRVWIIDPLDGTVNYVHRIPHVAVSVALWDNGRPLVGVIVDVARNEEYVAVEGEGASLNGAPIHVSDTARLADSLVITGFPYDRQDHAAAYLRVVEQVMKRSRGIRRMGAAALDLAWLACGRFDAYWEHGGVAGVKPWDLAAGSLLVTEAGGAFTDETGTIDQLEARAFVASNGKFHEELRAIVVDAMPEHLR